MVKGLAASLTNPENLIRSIIFLVIGITILSQTLGDIVEAIINISIVPNIGFSSFFASGGIILLALSAAVVLAILGVLGLTRGGAKR